MNVCDCGNDLKKSNAKKCRECFLKGKYHCKECKKKTIKNKTGFCKNCWNEYRSRKRNCKTCQNEMQSKGSSKDECRSCYDRRKRNENLEDHNRKSREYKRKIKGKLVEGKSKRGGDLGHIEKSTGYRTLHRPGHPNAKNKQGRIYEHTVIMTELLKRPLKKEESIHHKNGIIYRFNIYIGINIVIFSLS